MFSIKPGIIHYLTIASRVAMFRNQCWPRTVEMESLQLETPLSRLVTVIPNEGLFNPLKRLFTLGGGDYFAI